MTQPTNRTIIQAIDDLSSYVQDQTTAIRAESLARNRKVTWLQRLMFVVVPSLVLLVVLAVTNFVVISRVNGAASSAKDTQQTIASCLTPNTECSNQSKQQIADLNNTQRQTTFVLFVCARQFPNPPNPTREEIDANTQKLVSCVQEYYPDFKLPPKVG